MRTLLFLGLALLVSGLVDAAGKKIPPKTYVVVVGAEDSSNTASINYFFPQSLTIRSGDTVSFTQTTHEPHTVTFLQKGQPIPPFIIPMPDNKTLQLNPVVFWPTVPKDNVWDGTTYVNSGAMFASPGRPQTFNLTFSRVGTYRYVCAIHGQAMSGVVKVVAKTVRIPPPLAVKNKAAAQLAFAYQEANQEYKNRISQQSIPSKKLPDGTTQYYVVVGGMAMLPNPANKRVKTLAVDYMDFFPRNLTARKKDTITWVMSKLNMDVPHTVTFLNGGAIPPLATFVQKNPPPPYAQLNPKVVAPAQLGAKLTRAGYFNSGFMMAPGQNVTWTLGAFITGQLPYLCVLHYASGMVANLNIL